MINDEVNQRAELNCIEGAADSRLILHVANAKIKCFRNFLVLSNDSDVGSYLLPYFDQFKTKNDEKIGVKCELKVCHRHLLIHHLAEILGSGNSRAFLETLILTGCNFTSKVRSKLSFINTKPKKSWYE